MRKPIKVAIMYDFDKTLSPKDMQEYGFIPDIGIKNPSDFWRESNSLAIEKGMDKILAYMYVMLKKATLSNKPITRIAIVDKGRSVKLFKGVSTWFKRINEYGKSKGAEVEHYIISSGLKEIIEGTEISKEFKKIYASEFMYDANGVAVWPSICVNYTSKTQFLFRINKGALDITDDESINKYVPEENRPIPFKHMIYIGDGYTDVPCMKLVKTNGGHSIVVYKPNSEKKSKTALPIVEDYRADYIASADYSPNKKLENIVKTIIDKIVSDSTLNKLKHERKITVKK